MRTGVEYAHALLPRKAEQDAVAGHGVKGQPRAAQGNNGQLTPHMAEEAYADPVAAQHSREIIAGQGPPVQRGKGKQLSLSPTVRQNHDDGLHPSHGA